MKVNRLNRVVVLIFSILFVLSSCTEDDKVDLASPEIGLVGEDVIFNVKVGKTLKITPNYKNAENAVFSWKINGKVVSTQQNFEFTPLESGSVFVSLDVINNIGSSYLEMKINILDLLPPKISMSVPEQGFKIIKGSDLELKPVVENTDSISYSWKLGNVEKSTEKDFTFNSSETGVFNLKLFATNKDGEDMFSIPVTVCKVEDMPFSWSFERDTFNVSSGRTVRIVANDIVNDFGGDIIWSVDGVEKKKGKEKWYDFVADNEGFSSLKVKMKNMYNEVTKDLTVKTCPAEGKYIRKATESSSSKWNKVYEFLPAPGQFVNENYTANTMQEAISYAEGRLKMNGYVSLGGFGGYIVIGFDHSVVNDGGYNIQIKGNSFKGSSEPGILWVMQDENGDGLPNDTWYELKGSETGKPETISDYAVTYFKPKFSGMPTQWKDNQGNKGCIDYLVFHQQDYYYPAWVKTSSYTLRGTCLKSKTNEKNPGYWENGEFEWGYVDNFSPVDRLTDDDNYGASINNNHFKIKNAIKHDGTPMQLKYIDFVKVVVGVNSKAGWLGEVSTEVFDVVDYNLVKNKK
jgi:hypothetical protein